MEKKLLSINEAIEVLGVSRATFNKIRKENKFSEVTVGKRVRFDKDELLLVLKKASEAVADKKKVTVQYPSAIQQQNEKVILNIFSEQTLQEIEVHENVFDLTLLEQIDPYAAVSMLCEFYGRTRMGAKIKLLVNEGVACQDLRSMQFFYYVESLCKQNVIWDNQVFTGKSVDDTSLLLPITSIKATGAERLVAEKLIGFMKRQGFKEDIGRAIAHIIGELADNSMTHSAEALSDRMCFISAERTLYREKNCIVVGLADPSSCNDRRGTRKT